MSEQLIELTEYETIFLDQSAISYELGEHILYSFSDYVNVEFPSPKTKNRWELRASGWVGVLRINDNISLSLTPKIRTQNVFSMWEYAYRLKSFKIMGGIINCDTIDAFYNQIALLLAKRILERCRKGLYKSYEDRSERLSYLVGRMDMMDRMRRPVGVYYQCDYQENTVDNEENQILMWTLHSMLSKQKLRKESNSVVKKTYMSLQGIVGIKTKNFSSCIGRNYNSLNGDYQLLHALCRFILENVGPNGMIGRYNMMPFVLNMGRLYELFVSEWLQMNLPKSYKLKVQEKVSFGEDDKLHYNIDLVLLDQLSGNVVCVMDTKYKHVEKIQNEDMNQMLAYMEAKKCTYGILVYPMPASEFRKYQINSKTIWKLGFDINGDIESAGKNFIDELLNIVCI